MAWYRFNQGGWLTKWKRDRTFQDFLNLFISWEGFLKEWFVCQRKTIFYPARMKAVTKLSCYSHSNTESRDESSNPNSSWFEFSRYIVISGWGVISPPKMLGIQLVLPQTGKVGQTNNRRFQKNISDESHRNILSCFEKPDFYHLLQYAFLL